jgi:hypothetical protein
MSYSWYEYVGVDANGTRRVFGFGPAPDVAETECKRAALEYVGRRPDTGPLDKWTFENDRNY